MKKKSVIGPETWVEPNRDAGTRNPHYYNLGLHTGIILTIAVISGIFFIGLPIGMAIFRVCK